MIERSGSLGRRMRVLWSAAVLAWSACASCGPQPSSHDEEMLLCREATRVRAEVDDLRVRREALIDRVVCRDLDVGGTRVEDPRVCSRDLVAAVASPTIPYGIGSTYEAIFRRAPAAERSDLAALLREDLRSDDRPD